jgi:hypothetical protein
VRTFTKKELRLIEKLKKAPTQTTFDQREPCPKIVPRPIVGAIRMIASVAGR